LPYHSYYVLSCQGITDGLIRAGKPAEGTGPAGIISPVVKKRGKVITPLFGAPVQGESDFEAVRPFRESELIQRSVGLDTAFSAETVRIYLDKMTETAEQVEGPAVQPRECSDRLLSKARFTPVKTKRKADASGR
jgi:hypothetical protein